MDKTIIKTLYHTKEGNIYPLEFIFKQIKIDSVIYEPEKVRGWCKKCSNFGQAGGCPPRSPFFTEIVTPNDTPWLIATKFKSEYKPESIKKLNNIAMHWKFQDAILARLLNRVGHSLVSQFGGQFLATGYCMGCTGKKCSFKLGSDSCRNPSKRTYSMEATGINVVKTVANELGETMHWYKKGGSDVPYMLKCILFLPQKAVKPEFIADNLRKMGSGLTYLKN